MNFRRFSLTLALWTAGQAVVFSQGSFQNLDFEDARLPILSSSEAGFFTNAANAVPSWSVFYGAEAAPQVMYHATSLGATMLSVLDVNMPPSTRAISGSFSVGLFASSPGFPVDLTIAQNGTVPTYAQSFRFKVRGTIPEGWLEVFFHGELLPIQQLESLPDGSNVYGSDISAFASQYGELSLIMRAPTPIGARARVIDDIEFSPIPVPEPSTSGLFLLGLAGLAAWRFHRHRPMSTVA